MRLRIVLPDSPLRDTVTASGPIDLGSMFEAGNALIESPESVADAASANATQPAASARADTTDNRRGEEPAASENGNGVRRRLGRANDLARAARSGPLSETSNRCKHAPQTRADGCRGAHRVETAARTQAGHPRQASASAPRHHT
jgi:hypothetical protein